MPDSGFQFGATAVETSTGGATWSGLGNLFADDGANASVVINVSNISSNTFCIKNFTLGISGNDIVGIELIGEVNFFSADTLIPIVPTKNGLDAEGTPSTIESGNVQPDGTFTLGGASYLWNGSFSVSEVNNSDFGFLVYTTNGVAATDTVTIDWLQVKVYYTPVITDAVEKIHVVSSGRRW